MFLVSNPKCEKRNFLGATDQPRFRISIMGRATLAALAQFFLRSFQKRQHAARRPLERHTGNHQPVYLTGAFKKTVNARIAIGALHRVILMEAVAAVNLDTFV